jgi:K+-sensing histidine kinase KdpD
VFERILVCLDGSKLAEQILPHATEQALRFNGKLTLLQVITMPSNVSVASAEGTSARIDDIIVFDMDAVITDTATIHAATLTTAPSVS